MLHFVLFLICQSVVQVLFSTCCSDGPLTTDLFNSFLYPSASVISSPFIFTVLLGGEMVLQAFQDLHLRA